MYLLLIEIIALIALIWLLMWGKYLHAKWSWDGYDFLTKFSALAKKDFKNFPNAKELHQYWCYSMEVSTNRWNVYKRYTSRKQSYGNNMRLARIIIEQAIIENEESLKNIPSNSKDIGLYDGGSDRKKRCRFLADNDRKFGESLTTKPGMVPPTLWAETIISLLDADRDKLIRLYLDQVFEKDPNTEENNHFLLRVFIADAYLAPQQLVVGLLKNFSEEWGPLMRAMQKSMEDRRAEHKNIVDISRRNWDKEKNPERSSFGERQQLINHYATGWLMWGPSIPLCNNPECEHMKPSCPDPDPDLRLRFLQLGYGDESNSLPLLLASQPDAADKKRYSFPALREIDFREKRAVRVSVMCDIWRPEHSDKSIVSRIFNPKVSGLDAVVGPAQLPLFKGDHRLNEFFLTKPLESKVM